MREGDRRHGDDQRRREDRDERAEHRVDPLVVDPPRGDPLVDDVRLLEEELPRRDRRPDDRDDQEHRCRVESTRYSRHRQTVDERPDMRMAEDRKRDHQEVGDDEDEHEAFPAPEAAGRGHDDEEHRRDRDRDVVTHAEVVEREADPDELRGDRQEIQDEEIPTENHPQNFPNRSFMSLA